MKTPGFWYRPAGFLSTLLAPLSLIYAAGRWLDVAFARPQSFSQPVVCIGNAVAGGAGKTPTALALAELLKDIQPHIVSRGYGGSAPGPRRVLGTDTADLVGDETLLLSGIAPTWVAKDRALGIGCAFSAGAALVLLDDGLQNTKVQARLNLLVVDSASGFGNGQLMPAGPLREFPIVLKDRVDALVMIGEDTQKVAKLFPGKPVFGAKIEPDSSHLDTSRDYIAFAGLARPEKFFKTCDDLGLKVVEKKSFADHQPYGNAERANLLNLSAKKNADLLTTTKDAMRWPAEERHLLSVLPIKLVFDQPQQLRDFIKGKLNV